MAALAVLLAALWSMDAWLWFRLRMIANESIAANPENPLLSIDAVEELNRYTPRRLAKFLSSSSPRIRDVVCRALKMRRGRSPPEEWEGVLPELIRVFRLTEDDMDRSTVAHAIRSLSSLPRQDMEAVFDFADAQMKAPDAWWPPAAALLHSTGNAYPDLLPKVLDAFVRSLESLGESGRHESLYRLSLLDGKSPQTAQAVRIASKDGRVVLLGSSPMQSIIQHRPDLIDDLLSGTRNQKGVVLGLVGRGVHGHSMPYEEAKNRPRYLSSEQFQRLSRFACEVLAEPKDRVDNEFVAAVRVIGATKDGAERLFSIARSSDAARRTLLLQWTAPGVRRLNAADAQGFFAERFDELLAWLEGGDDGVRRAVLALLLLYPPPASAEKRRDAERLLDAARRLFDKHPQSFDFDYLKLLALLAPTIDVDDADRAAAALERVLMEYQTNFDRTGYKPQGYLFEAFRRLADRLEPHRSRPAVQRTLELKERLEEEGIVGPPPG